MDFEEIQGIPGAFLGNPQVHDDERGFFLEILRERSIGARFVQSNHSHSHAGVLRGLHYHRKQADLWYVIYGEAQAIVADLRKGVDSPNTVSIDLSGKDRQVLFIPPGVAHGYLAITELDLVYWVTHYYDASDEFGIAWDDPTIGAPWKTNNPLLSGRDRANPKLEWDSIRLS